MAPQKRKRPHDSAISTGGSERRATRQHPAEPEHQLRSGRARVVVDDKPPATNTERRGSLSKKNDASGRPSTRDRAAAATTARQLRGSRQLRHGPARAVKSPAPEEVSEEAEAEAEEEEEEEEAKPLAEKTNRTTSRQPQKKQKNSRGRPPIERKPPTRRPSHSSSSRKPTTETKATRSVQLPPQSAATASSNPTSTDASAATNATLTATPKRLTASTGTSKTPKPPGTPHSDRNIDKVVFGNIAFKAWYPSYYAKEVLGDVSGNSHAQPSTSLAANGGGGGGGGGGGKRDMSSQILDRLYICPCCFKYSRDTARWLAHVKVCETRCHVPGRKVYTHPSSRVSAAKGVKVPRHSGSGPSPNTSSTKSGKRKRHSDDVDGKAVPTATEGDTNSQEGEWSVWEVDGEEEGLFCQNLSLFAKLFLDNKSVFFDVTEFNYFLLVYTPSPSSASPHPTSISSAHPPTNSFSPPLHDPNQHQQQRSPLALNSHAVTSALRPQIVGFFSKEKMSWDNNNLACILVFPPWQRKGLGPLLMGVSYEISRREGILGGPEKPISELGRKGYKRFWAGEIARWILDLELPTPPTPPTARHTRRRDKGDEGDNNEKEKKSQKGGEEDESQHLIVDINQCSQETWIVPEDCLATLRDMGLVEETSSSAGSGVPSPPAGENANTMADTKENVKRVKIDRAAVRDWTKRNRVDVSRTCDPAGFVEGYAVKEAGEEEEV
ncbi:acyl-CoA N-acyltransferase [Xylariaceae sp. FL0255]|nr:acyl-CoA N-acyltransferase [Xylariaceae sp. FL0255]